MHKAHTTENTHQYAGVLSVSTVCLICELWHERGKTLKTTTKIMFNLFRIPCVARCRTVPHIICSVVLSECKSVDSVSVINSQTVRAQVLIQSTFLVLFLVIVSSIWSICGGVYGDGVNGNSGGTAFFLLLLLLC